MRFKFKHVLNKKSMKKTKPVIHACWRMKSVSNPETS